MILEFFFVPESLNNIQISGNGKWFEPRSLSRLCGLIVRVRVVLRRTVVGDIDRRFDNLSGSHHQSHVNCVSSVSSVITGSLTIG